jgi:hypothetical protein
MFFHPPLPRSTDVVSKVPFTSYVLTRLEHSRGLVVALDRRIDTLVIDV